MPDMDKCACGRWKSAVSERCKNCRAVKNGALGTKNFAERWARDPGLRAKMVESGKRHGGVRYRNSRPYLNGARP